MKTVRGSLPIATLLLVAVVAAGACGSPDDERAQTVPDRQVEGEGDSPAARIDGSLLTVADMPNGYLQEQDPSSLEATSSASSQECRTFVSYLGDKGIMDPANPKRFVAFSHGQSSRVVHGVILLREKVAEEYIIDLQEKAGNCQGWTEQGSDGTPIQYRVEALDLPKVADETLAFSLASERGGTRIGLDIAVIRSGTNLAMIGLSHIGAVDNELLERLVRVAGDRLANAG